MKPTSLTLTAALAQRFHRALIDTPVETVDEIYTHPAVRGFHPDTIGRLLDQLTADGLITEDAEGNLLVTPLSEAA